MEKSHVLSFHKLRGKFLRLRLSSHTLVIPASGDNHSILDDHIAVSVRHGLAELEVLYSVTVKYLSHLPHHRSVDSRSSFASDCSESFSPSSASAKSMLWYSAKRVPDWSEVDATLFIEIGAIGNEWTS